jgi:hypothetical protein
MFVTAVLEAVVSCAGQWCFTGLAAASATGKRQSNPCLLPISSVINANVQSNIKPDLTRVGMPQTIMQWCSGCRINKADSQRAMDRDQSRAG